MKRTIIFLSPIIVVLILCFTGYSAFGLYTGDAGTQRSDSTKKDPPVDLNNIKKLQPFSVEGGILIPFYGLPSEEQQQAAAAKKETSSSALSNKNETRGPRYKEGEVLVKYKKGVTLQKALSNSSVRSMSVAKAFKYLSQKRGQTYVMVKSNKLKVKEIVEQLSQDPSVDSLSLNYERRITATTPNDPYFSYLWGLNNTGQDGDCGAGTPDADIDAPEAWDLETGDPAVVVADIDTGVDYNHVDLASNMWHNPGEIPGNSIDDDGNGYIDDVYGIDAYNSDSDPMDDHSHGTHTSGTIAAAGNNNIGITGVAWNTKIMALKFLSANGGGYDSDAITCIEYAIAEKLYHNVNVVAINAYWGGGGYNQLLRDTIEEAGNAGILFCAASGGSGSDNDVNPAYPASYDLPTIIAVAASDHNDQLAYFSNYGKTSVDLAAPGDYILSTVPGCSGGSTIFFDDMESGVSSWVVNSNTTNTWAITTEASYSPTHAWSDSPGGNYGNNTDSRLALSHDIDLSSYSGSVTFYFYGDVSLESGYDALYVDFSSDSGATWTSYGYLSGDYGGWYSFSVDLPNEFKTAHFRLRFHLVTDDSVTYDGVYIDDVGIYACQQSDSYAFMSGTSMATPHVSGTVAVLAAGYPGDDVQTRKSRILSGVDQKPAFSGKMVTGGRLSLFNNPPNPAPFINSVSPDCVPSNAIASTTVNIYGGNFANTATVKVGTTPAAQTSVLSADHIQIKLPSLSNGTYDITVTNPDNQSATFPSAVTVGETCGILCVCDINGDGNCTPQDALCSFQKYLGICPTSCGPCDDICCDVNNDGSCTPADALCRFQHYLGIHPNCFD